MFDFARTRVVGWCCAALVLSSVAIWALVGAQGSARTRGAQLHGPLTVLPISAQGPVAAALGADKREYRVNRLSAVNPGQRLRASFSPAGATIRSGRGVVSMSLTAIGRGGTLTSVPRAVPTARANRVTYGRGAVSEWYANGPLGLEQGFDVARALAGGSAPLTLSLALGGNLHAGLSASNLRLEGHGVSLRYGGLYATDASGRRLPASLSLSGRDVRITVDDRGASYPVRVDPFVQQAELTPSDAVGGDTMGYSVAVSADGSTIVTGAPFRSLSATSGIKDAVYVFTKPASGWANATQTAELTATGDSGLLGSAVAVSADGSTIVAGAEGVNIHTGAAFVYTRPASGWANATQTAELTASDGGELDQLGNAVAISADGNTIAAGAHAHSVTSGNQEGAVYVFTKPGAGWADATQTAELTGSDSSFHSGLGDSVAISPAGDEIFAGAGEETVGSNNGQGAAYVFDRPGSGWTNATQTAELTAADGGAGEGFGGSISATDGAIVVGAPDHTIGNTEFTNQGAAYVFAKPAGGWGAAPQAVELTLSSGEPGGGFGRAVAISGDTVVVGAPAEPYGGNIYQGLVYVAQFSSGWSTLTSQQQLTAANGSDYDGLGGAVGVGGDSIAAGANNVQVGDVHHAGAVYAFAEPASSGGGAGGGGGTTGTGSGGGTGANSGHPGPSVKLGAIKVSGNTVSVQLSCTNGTGTCPLRLALSVIEKLKGSKLIAVAASKKVRKKTVVLAGASITIAAGKSGVVKLKLRGAGKRLLGKRHRLTAMLTVSQGKTVMAKRSVHLKAPKRK